MSDEFNPHAGDLTIQALQRNGEYYSEVLSLFQQNHDECVSSGFFPQETITEIDACGLNFRKLGLESISVATAVAAQWVPSVLTLYNYIADYPIENIKSQLVLLGGQAKELGRLFQVIEEWARYVAGRIHSLYKKIENDIDGFKTTFAREVEDADLKLSQARNVVREKKDELEDKKAEEDRWKYSLYASSIGYAYFFFTGVAANIITGVGYAVAKSARNSAQDAVYEAEKGRNEAQKVFDAATTKKEKAEKIGETAGKLIGALKGLEFLSETMATYWTSQSDNFTAVGGNMSVNQAMLPKVILELRISPQAIEDWDKTKEGFESYVTVMTRIVNLFNFSTTAEPPAMHTITAAELSFELSVPTSIDAISIMNPT